MHSLAPLEQHERHLTVAAGVQIDGLRRRFPGADRPAVDDLSLTVATGETLCLVGPSGCGKSTTLRIVAGLDFPDGGTVSIDGRAMADVPPQDRDVAMVFQGFALYPHMRVREILAFPMKMRGVPPADRDKAIGETAEMLGITRLLDRRPAQLSGGEQQRVAMGRAIVRRPKVFLFDEPLSNLDAALRAELRVELRRLLERLEATAVYVTHDQAEAMTLGDRIAVLNAGHLEQVDTPRVIYEEPATKFVAGFFGTPPMNLVDARRDGARVHALGVDFDAPEGDAKSLVLGVRPEHVHVVADEAVDGHVTTRGTVRAVEPHGAESHIDLDIGGESIRARVEGFAGFAPGAELSVSVDPARVHFFDEETGRAV